MTNVLAQTLTDACGVEPGFICEWVFDTTDSEAVAEIVGWLVERPLKIVVILFGAWIVNRFVTRAVDRLVNRLVESRVKEEEAAGSDDLVARLGRRARNKLQRIHEQAERSRQRAVTLGAVLRSIASFAIYIMAVLAMLGELGLDLGPFIAGAGIVGFGAQSLVADFIAGIFIIIEDQYGVGDFVDVGTASGTVERVTLRTTVMRDVHGTVWVVPNGEIRRVGNSSQIWARTVLDVDVAYDTDIDLAASVIKSVADEVWNEGLDSATILEEPEIWGVQNFGADAISIRLAVKTEAGEQWATGRIIRARLKKAFDVHGIEIPFPQRTVWVNTVTDRTKADAAGTAVREDLLERRSGSDGEE